MIEASEMMGYKKWIVVGDVGNDMKYAGRIYNKLKNCGYDVVGMHPRNESDVFYSSFEDLKRDELELEVLNLVVNPVRGLEIVKEAHDYGIKFVLAQPGARSHEIKDFCENNGMEYAEGCALVELNN